ncbi:MAG: glutamate 5-kinase [Clostridia bacterium]|nr:glutamate 5-kinase [Clostridia bacterium]MBQ4627668.1 glutamate 5-kinase [Clostridia bacterium]
MSPVRSQKQKNRKQGENNVKIVIKVGSSTLTHASGKLDFRMIDRLVRVIADIKNEGHQVVLVSSGAQVAGMSRLRLERKPDEITKKQALAAVGQCELMAIYDRFFSDYGYNVGQILLNKQVIDIPSLKENVTNTFNALLEYDCVPIVNENDSVEVEEIKIGENDTLSALVATFIGADKLIMLTDVDAFYDGSPDDEASRPIPVIEVIDDRIRQLAGGAGSDKGTGGMFTKVSAAEIATNASIDVHIVYGKKPDLIYDVLDGKRAGTVFKKKKQEN